MVVIDADKIDCAGADNIIMTKRIVIGIGDGPRAVEAFYNGSQLAGDAGAAAVSLFAYFIADAPNKHGRMVAVAAHLVFEVGAVPIIPVEAVIVFCFTALPHIKGLVHHDKAHAIAKVQQLGSGRVVRSADGIATHPF